MRLMLPALLAVTIFGGVASADPVRRGHDGGRQVQRRHDTHVAQPHRVDHGSRHTAPVVSHGGHRSGRISHGTASVYAPVITHRGGDPQTHATRHTDYHRRPALIAENHSDVRGYVWIDGQWAWNGYEWNWQPGRYEIDPAYSAAQPSYYSGY